MAKSRFGLRSGHSPDGSETFGVELRIPLAFIADPTVSHSPGKSWKQSALSGQIGSSAESWEGSPILSRQWREGRQYLPSRLLLSSMGRHHSLRIDRSKSDLGDHSIRPSGRRTNYLHPLQFSILRQDPTPTSRPPYGIAALLNCSHSSSIAYRPTFLDTPELDPLTRRLAL